MTKSDLELFKEALTEGLSIRFQNEIDSFEGEVVISERHERAMRTIFNGVQVRPFVWPSARAKIAAAAVAATMLLASCAAAYSDEIRDFVETIYEDYISIKFSNGNSKSDSIKEIYTLGYIPESYVLKEFVATETMVYYLFEDSNNNTIDFCQWNIDSSIFGFDTEKENYTEIINIGIYEVYHKKDQEEKNGYLWNDGKYAMTICSTEELSHEELENIINGLKTQ